MPEVELKGNIRWADADAAGRLYYPRIFDYAGEAELELLRSLGYSREEGRAGGYDFPRIHVECRFKKVLSLGTAFTMRMGVGRLGRTSIRYDFSVHLDSEPAEAAAEGSVTVVVIRDGKPVELPESLRAALS